MRRHKIFWGSSYDRGIQNLLFIWPDILSEYPKAELHITYGWDLFVKGYQNNAERMSWKESVDQLIDQKGVIHHGRVGKDELQSIRKECGIWAYPTSFTEINCITALECQRDGVVPIVTSVAALKETVGSGVKIEEDIQTQEGIDKFKEELLSMMGNAKKWNTESKKAVKFSKKYDWENIAKDWKVEFDKLISEPKVSIITPTARRGFWHLMGFNLSTQTYKNFEWIVIDDSGRDIEETPNYFGLDIVVIKSDDYKNPVSLSHANNLGMEAASGELLVWLQDFVMIPEYGIEMLVDLYRRNKNAIIAPTDIHYALKEGLEADFTKDDAFKGKCSILGEVVFNNPRNDYKGIRRSTNPYDFEMNYAAIPAHIARDLNGWWELMDEETTGYDNTEFAWRALESGYELIVDDTNKASCLRHQNYIIEEDRGNRNKKRFDWIVEKTKSGELPLIRDEKAYEKIK